MLGVSEEIARHCFHGTARIMVEGRLETAADLRQRGDQWALADGGLSSNLEVLSDGSLRLKPTASAAVGPSTVTNSTTFWRSKESGYAGPFVDPISNLDGTKISGGHVGVNLQWTGNQLASYASVQAWLHPKYDPAKAKYVKWWHMELLQIVGPFTFGKVVLYQLVPILNRRVEAFNEAAGWVTFPFTDNAGKSVLFHPEPYIASGIGPGVPHMQPGSEYVVLCHGYDALGAPASNIGWGYDSASNTYTVGSAPNSLKFLGIVLGIPSVSKDLNPSGGVTRNSSATEKMSALQFVPATFPASATVTFAFATAGGVPGGPGGPLDLVALPTAPPEFVVRTDLPAGTGVIAQVQANMVDDGEFEADIFATQVVNGSTLAWSNAQAHSGTRSIKVTTANLAASGVRITRRHLPPEPYLDGYAGTPGRDYTQSIWVYAPAGSVGKTLTMVLGCTDGIGGGLTPSPQVDQVLVLGWQLFTVNGAAPAGTVTIEPYVFTKTAQGVFDFYVDDVTLAPTGTSPSYLTVVDGQTTEDLGLNLQPQYAVRATLSSSADGSRSPILHILGARVVVARDLGEVADLRDWQEHVDPMTHQSEVGQCAVSVLKDGIRDYRDDITRLLSENGPGLLYFRVYVFHRDVPRSKWLHREDFIIDDSDPRGAHIGITGVSVLARLRQSLPKLTADSIAVPIADVSNPGGWTASTGLGWQQLADVAPGSVVGTPDDTTYIESVANPSNAQYTITLSSIGTPAAAIPNQIFLQARTALGAGTTCSLKLELMEGATVRATLPSVAVTAPDTGQGSYVPIRYGLTIAEINSVTDWSALRIRFSATGSGGAKVRVGWARLVILGIRADLQYPSSATPANTVQGCRDDLLDNQIGLDQRYRGPSYTDTTPPLVAAKTIRTDPSGETDLTRAGQELDALNYIAGYADIASQGRVKSIPLYRVTALTDLITGTTTAQFTPLIGPVRAIIPIEEVEPISCGQGWRQRVPRFAIAWGWDGQRYGGEAQIENQMALTYFHPALIDPKTRAPAIVSRWLPGDGLARGLALRHGQMFGLGLMEWRVRFTHMRPWLEAGDLVTFGTDRLVAFDPVATRAIAGRQWVTAMINGRWDGLGREFSVWIQTFASVQVVVTGATPQLPVLTEGVLNGNFEETWQPLAGIIVPTHWASENGQYGVETAAPYAGLVSFKGSYLVGDFTALNRETQYAAFDSPYAYNTVRPGEVLSFHAVATDGLDTAVGVRLFDAVKQVIGDVDVLTWTGNTGVFIVKEGTYTIPDGVAYIVALVRDHHAAVGPYTPKYDDVRIWR